MASPNAASIWGNTPTPVSSSDPAAIWGSTPAAPSHPAAAAVAPSRKGGGGFLGTLENIGKTAADVVTLGGSGATPLGGGYVPSTASLAHFGATKAGLAAHDIAGIPGGFIKLAGDAIHSPNWWEAPGGLHGVLQQYEHPLRPVPGDKLSTDVQGMVVASGQSLAHPLRDPFQTALTVSLLANGGAGALARLHYATEAAKVGEVSNAVKSLSPLAKPPVAGRSLTVPKLVGPVGGGEGPSLLSSEHVSLHPSQGSAARLVQRAHDALVQHALNRNVVGEQGLLQRYGASRVAKAVNETQRIQQNLRAVPGGLLGQASRGRHAFDKGVSQKVGQLALFLHSANVSGEEAAAYWAHQAASGVNRAETSRLADLAAKVHEQGLLHLGADGNLTVDAERFPKLAAIKDLTQQAQGLREDAITKFQAFGPETSQILSDRKNLVAETIGSETARNAVTGLRTGQGYTSLRTSVKRSPASQIRQARVPVIGKAGRFVDSKAATGLGIPKGLIPDNTTAGVIRGLHDALRFVNTTAHRSAVARFGSDVRRTPNDVLIRDPAAGGQADIPLGTKQLLGVENSTLNTIPEAEHQGLAAGLRAHLVDAIPGMADSFAKDHAAGLGTPAPPGFKWVNERLLGDLTKSVTPRGRPAKFLDAVNSAVTAATVYFKVGHLTTRGFTNAFTNIIQGSARPVEIARTVKLVRSLSPTELQESYALTGTHGVQALPHEGTGRVAQVATKGAGWWARRIDAPFRINSVAYEARQAGYRTPEEFKGMLRDLKTPDPSARALTVAREANRSAIMYDGLGPNEQRIITRAFWFYPWTKGAARWSGHAFATNAFKATALGSLGQLGRVNQFNILGAVPDYENGLVPFGSGANPRVSNFGTFMPLDTTANLFDASARPGEVSGFLNPTAAGALTAFTGVNQFGNKTKKPLTDALAQVFSPAPESQILTAALRKSKPTAMFQTTPRSALERALGGPAVPRRVNKSALNKNAARQRSGN